MASCPRRMRPLLPLALLAATLLAALAACAGARPAAELTPDRKEELAGRWRLYLAQDPQWPQAREQWLSGPAHERELLLDNLLIELLRDDGASRGSGTAFRSQRARQELAWFGSDAIPFLVEAMRTLAARDSVDVVALDRVGLALVELHATAELAALATHAPGTSAADRSLRLRFAAVRALGHLPEPAATAALAERLTKDPAWQVRGVAADVLRKRVREPAARAALVQALSDPDGYVRGQAVRALVVGLDPADDKGALERVLAFLLQDPAPEARAAAAESLELIAFDPRVEGGLVRALADPDLGVVQKAAHSLMNVRTPAAQRGLADALERAVRRRAEGLVSELLVILEANVGSRPRDINPAGWRALIERQAQER